MTLIVMIVVSSIGRLLVVLGSHVAVGVSLMMSVASVNVFVVDTLVAVSSVVDLRVVQGHLGVIATLVVALSI